MGCCPLVIRSIKVRSLSVEYNEISWELESTTVDVLDFTFQVLRSEGVEGPYEELSDQFGDQYIFVDDSIKSFDRYRQRHYRVRIRCKSTDEFWDFGPATLGQDTDLVASELRSHITLLMREFIGEKCWVLPVRTFGQRCKECWSESLKKKTRTGCRTCWDTSFVRGYMHPIEAWISLDPNPQQNQHTNVGKLQQSDTTARLTYYPPCKPGDLIITAAHMQRFKVVQVSQTKHVGSPVHQELQIHEVPQSNIDYLIPLKLCDELKNIFMKPERQFTNPTQLESLSDEAVNGIFSVYQTHNCKDPPC